MSADGSRQTEPRLPASGSRLQQSQNQKPQPETSVAILALERRDGLFCEITRTCARVIHLTTGTFNLIVKDRKQDPPEGTVFSPERSCTGATSSVLETFQTYRAELLTVNPLCSQDFHLFFTLGELRPEEPSFARPWTAEGGRPHVGNSHAGSFLETATRVLPLLLGPSFARLGGQECPRHTRRRKSLNLRKDHLEVVATNAKPFEEPCPRMTAPWPELISEYLLCL